MSESMCRYYLRRLGYHLKKLRTETVQAGVPIRYFILEGNGIVEMCSSIDEVSEFILTNDA